MKMSLKVNLVSIFILQPSAICCGWELDGIYHEMEDNRNLENKIEDIMNSFNLINNENITLQLVTDRGQDLLPNSHDKIVEPKIYHKKM